MATGARPTAARDSPTAQPHQPRVSYRSALPVPLPLTVWQVKHPTWDLYGGTHYLRPSFEGVRASMAAGPDLRTLCQRHFAWSRDMDLNEDVGVDQGHSAGKERRGSSASSLEIIGPERLSARRSVTVAAKGIQTLESSPVVGGKLEGCLGASISALLARVVGDRGDGAAAGSRVVTRWRSDGAAMAQRWRSAASAAMPLSAAPPCGPTLYAYAYACAYAYAYA